MPEPLLSIEICAGAGGQALGLENAGFEHVALVENDEWACKTLRTNRPDWTVVGPHAEDSPPERRGKGDVRKFDATGWRGKVALLAGGVPCPPFSKAGRQLGESDERDLFPEALRLVQECQPPAVMLENVRGILDSKFVDYRDGVRSFLEERGYRVWWGLIQASSFGVPQLRPRAVLVAIESSYADHFVWPEGDTPAPTVGEALREYMAVDGWRKVRRWARKANQVAPTLVGGSKRHGGPDLGPTRAKREWSALGVDGHGLADSPPSRDFSGMPRLTVEMASVIQGFDPSRWPIHGRKTAAYRQVGNAFPPPVAQAFGEHIRDALLHTRNEQVPRTIRRKGQPKDLVPATSPAIERQAA
jgi:DNA (cytosine-5)-methyltransferase 1